MSQSVAIRVAQLSLSSATSLSFLKVVAAKVTAPEIKRDREDGKPGLLANYWQAWGKASSFGLRLSIRPDFGAGVSSIPIY